MKKTLDNIDDYLADRIDFYKEILFLESYDIGFQRQSLEDNEEFTFEVEARPPYREATISYYTRAEQLFEEGEFDTLDAKILHELLHVVVAPMSHVSKRRYVTEDEINNADETATDWLTEIIHSLV